MRKLIIFVIFIDLQGKKKNKSIEYTEKSNLGYNNNSHCLSCLHSPLCKVIISPRQHDARQQRVLEQYFPPVDKLL